MSVSMVSVTFSLPVSIKKESVHGTHTSKEGGGGGLAGRFKAR